MMEELSHQAKNLADKENNGDLTSLLSSSGVMSDPVRQSLGKLIRSDIGSSDDDAAPRKRIIKRVKRFSDSDSNSDKEEEKNVEMPGLGEYAKLPKSTLQSSDSDLESDTNISNTVSNRTRIQRNGISSSTEESGSENTPINEEQELHTKQKQSKLHKKFKSLTTSKRKGPTPTNIDDKVISGNTSDDQKSPMQQNADDANPSLSDTSESDDAVKNNEQQMRIKNKRDMLQNKFKTLVSSRKKDTSSSHIVEEVNKSKDRDDSTESDEDMASIEKIKQKIKQRMSSFNPSICDPDTSDEESSHQKPVYKQKKERRKQTKPTSPKPQRMSAKQAMENMQKIKSESNRMLREKEVSLPYHRPKALSLKDIMSRRKVAVSSDGKSLPIKMNEEQLKQYAKMLEERQKEMMELCKSESEEEETNDNLADGDKASTTTTIGSNETKPGNIPSNENTNNIDSTTDTEIKEKMGIEDDLNEHTEKNVQNETNADTLPKEQDSDSSMQLVYNDSANSTAEDFNTCTEEASTSILEPNSNVDKVSKNIEEEICQETVNEKNEAILQDSETVVRHEHRVKSNTEVDSQLICLHHDSETIAKDQLTEISLKTNAIVENVETTYNVEHKVNSDHKQKSGENEGMEVDNEFSDDEINMADIDNIIENAEIIKDIEDKVNSQFLVRDKPLNLNPKLTGGPGMVIDLDSDDSVPRKSGIELLKERFTYFSKLKTPEELEREKETKLKPGTQLKKLKQELEEKIAEQRSLEWARRLENEKLQQNELKVLRGEASEEDDIDKIEAAIENDKEIEESEKSESDEEEEPIENDIEIKDRPRTKNAMVDDEAEESDCDEDENGGNEDIQQNDEVGSDDDGIEAENNEGDEEKESDSDSDESEESEEEQHASTKKGRILKAFEDSDEEEAVVASESVVGIERNGDTNITKSCSNDVIEDLESQVVSQDEVLPLAQRLASASDDLFTSQESVLLASETKGNSKDEIETFTQTFSILDSSKQTNADIHLNSSGKLNVVCNTQSLEVNNLEDIAEICPVTDSQRNLSLPSQIPTTQLSQSQPIGEDILAMCTGQFYDNQFVSQVDVDQIPLHESQKYEAFDNVTTQESQVENTNNASTASIDTEKQNQNITDNIELKEAEQFIELRKDDNKENKNSKMDDNLKSILEELDDPEFDLPRPNKFFVGSKNTQKDTEKNESVIKKKLIIDSDDETNEGDAVEIKKRKKLKKRKPEKRALQISDDEDEASEQDEIEEYGSDIEEEHPERLVEYDSEENEIEIKPQNPKKKRKTTEFFENEAELTSEDEWVGSGDEDEAGLDRMEREEGDDDTFHQGKLQRELGQIHMRDVLDQDKREVRLIQELLFEDGDLGGGGRQRKFKWLNMDGNEETGTLPDGLADTQEEEFESEEQWRKERHERETFLRQLKKKDDPDEGLNVSVNRTTIIKANLLSKTMSSLLMEVNNSTAEQSESPVEKKTKDIPSPKKPFSLLQQSYQGSLLSRGRGALARLAALAIPLADDEAKVGNVGVSNRRNFVFTTLTPDEKEPKVTKRKAESNPSTPKLVKKMRTEDKQNTSKSLLDHFKV